MKDNFSSLRQLDHHPNTPVRIYLNQEDDEYPPHWHQTYELIMPVRGRYRAAVDHMSYELLPGEIFLIPSGVVHELCPMEPGERYIIMIDNDMVMQIHGLPAFRQWFYPCVHLRADREPDTLSALQPLVREAIAEYQQGSPMAMPAIQAWLTVCLIRLGRWMSECHSAHPDEHRYRMNTVMLDVYAYVTEHCHERLSLEEIAMHSGYSKYHFARVFKEYTGTSFYDFYMRQRMQLCTRLLSEMSIPVTEVALRSGFGSIATFNRIFKHYQGITPTEYRKLNQLPPPDAVDQARDSNI